MGQAILKILSLQNIRQSAHQMSLEPKRRSRDLCFPHSIQNSIIQIFSTGNQQKNKPIISEVSNYHSLGIFAKQKNDQRNQQSNLIWCTNQLKLRSRKNAFCVRLLPSLLALFSALQNPTTNSPSVFVCLFVCLLPFLNFSNDITTAPP